MYRSLALLVVVCLLASPLVVAADVAADVEDPRFEVLVPDPVLDPGTERTLDLTLVLDARDPEDHVRPADAVRVEVTGGGPVEVRSGPRLVGRMVDGDARTVGVDVVIPENATAGAYDLRVRVTYEFDGERRTRRLSTTVRVAPRPRLRLVATESDVVVGETGTVTVTVENVGSRSATETRLDLTAGSPAISVDRTGDRVAESTAVGATGANPGRSGRFVGRLAPGERRTVSYAVTASEDARREAYALALEATYEDHRGRVTSQPVGALRVTPRQGPQFGLVDVSSDLYVGEEGELEATVRNRGDRPARQAVLHVETASQLGLPQPTVPLGRLGPDEGTSVSFPVRVPPGVDPGPRSFTATVEYVDGDGDRRRGDPVRFVRRVAPERDRLDLAAVNATVAPDESTRLVVRVTNVGTVRLTDLQARLAVKPPFTSTAPESFVPRLAPGESARFAFELTADEDAVANTHALAVNVTATDPDDDTVRSGPHLLAVRVAEPAGPDAQVSTLVGGVVVVALLLGAGWWWLRR